MKKWLTSAVALTFALGVVGSVTGFAFTADGGSDNPEFPGPADKAGEVSPSLPNYDEWLSDFGEETVVTSIDDINPNVCNGIHNINACTPEELEELGIAPTTGSITTGELQLETAVEGKPEPLFEDGEPGYIQTTNHACALDQGVYVTSEGQVGCVDVIALDDGRQDSSQEQPPMVVPQVEPSAE